MPVRKHIVLTEGTCVSVVSPVRQTLKLQLQLALYRSTWLVSFRLQALHPPPPIYKQIQWPQ